MRTRGVRVLALVTFVACSAPATPPPSVPLQNQHVGHRDGGRKGSHGMVLFGRTHHYLEHIPMFRGPHDAQVVMRVVLRDVGEKLITSDFSRVAHSVKPTHQFSLDDLMHGKQTRFIGDIHRGNFEDKGPLVEKDAYITVEAVLLARILPGDERIADGHQEYALFGEPDDAYLTNVIRASRGYQQILRIASITGSKPSPSRVDRIKAPTAERVAPGMAMALETGEGIVLGEELWCLEAPEFVNPCR